MSVRCIDWAVKESKNRSGVQQVVLLVLADCANNAGIAWPCMATLAQRTRLSTRTVQRAVKELLRCGDIISVRLGGGRWSSRYFLHRTEKASSAGGEQGLTPTVDRTGHSGQSGTAAMTTGQGTSVSAPDDPSLNRNLIPQRSGREVEESFHRFWEIYPRKDARDAALAAWRRIAPDARQTEDIITAVQRHAGTKQWADAMFIPYAVTYLQNARWRDAPAGAVVATQQGSVVPDHDRTQDYLRELRTDTR